MDPSGMEFEDPLENFKEMNRDLKEKVIDLGDIMLGSDPVDNPVYDYLVTYSSQLNEKSRELINVSIKEIQNIDESNVSMAIKRREKNAVEWETCYAIRNSEGGIPIYNDYFEIDIFLHFYTHHYYLEYKYLFHI